MISAVFPISRLSLVMMFSRSRSKIAVLHVAAVRPQMRGDSARARSLANLAAATRSGSAFFESGIAA